MLLGEDGAPFDEPTREVAFHVREPVWVNNHIHVLEPNARTNPRFLTYALNSVDWMPMVSGSTRFKLTQDDMMRARIPYLPLGTQQAIDDDLDIQTGRVGAIIASQRRMIELLDERRRALITSAVTGELAVPADRD